MTSQLHRLMVTHDLALAAFDAREDDYDKENDTTGHELDRARDAILAHRPTLGEIPVKAAFMLRNRTFTEWDDFEQRQLIEALTPVDGLAGASGAHETGPARAARNPVACRIPAARPCPAGLILLASIVGMAICTVWIAITWRAGG